MGNVSQTRIASTKVVTSWPYAFTDFTDANGTMNTVHPTTNEYTAPANGWVIGYSGRLNDDLTTGTLTSHATVNGSLLPGFEDADALLVPEHNYGYQMQDARKDLFGFNAGDRIGMSFRASDDVEPETADGAFLLVVLLEDVEY